MTTYRERREILGLSVRELAAASGVQANTVARLEAGEGTATPETVAAVDGALLRFSKDRMRSIAGKVPWHVAAEAVRSTVPREDWPPGRGILSAEPQRNFWCRWLHG